MNDESSRIAALKALEILDTAPHPAFDALTKAAAYCLETPLSLISLIDETRQWFKSCYGTNLCETDRAYSFCSHAIQSEGVFVVEDALADPVFASNPLVRGEPHVRFYAGAPLITTQGDRLGTLCVLDTKSRQLSDEEADILKSLSENAVHLIELSKKELLLQRAERVISRLSGRPVAAER